jgi:hypothetical protein
MGMRLFYVTVFGFFGGRVWWQVGVVLLCFLRGVWEKWDFWCGDLMVKLWWIAWFLWTADTTLCGH